MCNTAALQHLHLLVTAFMQNFWLDWTE